MFIFQQVLVNTDTEVRCLRLIRDARHLIGLMVGLAIANLHNRKPFVVNVHSKRAFILTIVRQLHHSKTHQVERDGKATERRDGVLLKGEKLPLGRGTCCRYQQQQSSGHKSQIY